MNHPTWVRPVRTAGMPPPGLQVSLSNPGAAASRMNDKGASYVPLLDIEPSYHVRNTADVRAALAS